MAVKKQGRVAWTALLKHGEQVLWKFAGNDFLEQIRDQCNRQLGKVR